MGGLLFHLSRKLNMKEKMLSKLYEWAERFILWYDSRVYLTHEVAPFSSTMIVTVPCKGQVKAGELVAYISEEDGSGYCIPCGLDKSLHPIGVAVSSSDTVGNINLQLSVGFVMPSKSK